MLRNPHLAEAALAEHPPDLVPVLYVLNLLQTLKVLETEDLTILLLHRKHAIFGRTGDVVVPETARDHLYVPEDELPIVHLPPARTTAPIGIVHIGVAAAGLLRHQAHRIW